jgi:murein DD-endopeptidase MepM/ murein hydrolase activator NlpD
VLAVVVLSTRAGSTQQAPLLIPPVLHPALVTWDPSSLVNGAPCLFRVKPSVPVKSLTGLWLTRTVPFEFDPADGSWFAFAGVGLNVSEGEYPLDLEGIGNDGSKGLFRANVRVERGSYRTVDLRVADRFTAPSAATRARIEREQALKADAFARSVPGRLWAGSFAPPIASTATDSFGVRRTFNGVQQSIHQGSDYRAKVGTPIAAMGAGRVLLARFLFFEGGCVFIDHGQGLITIYMHLSKFTVKEGDRVERGQRIGLSGATGRVTGPHLHVSVRWQGIYLDPLALVSLSLP